MAKFRGEGSMTDRNLLVYAHPDRVTKDGKHHFLDVQLDGRGDAQSNPHLTTQVKTKEDGSKDWSNQAPYASSQLDAIKEAAGDNVYTTDKGTQVYGVKASLMGLKPSDKPEARTGVIINTKKPMTASEFPTTEAGVTEHFAKMREAKAAAKEAAPEAQAAPEAEAQAPAPEPEPSV